MSRNVFVPFPVISSDDSTMINWRTTSYVTELYYVNANHVVMFGPHHKWSECSWIELVGASGSQVGFGPKRISVDLPVSEVEHRLKVYLSGGP